MKNLLLAAIFISATLFGAETERKTFESKGIKQIEITNGSGKVNVVAGDNVTTEVSAEKVKFGDNCKIRIEKDGSALEVVVTKTMFSDCEVNLNIKAPAAVKLEIKNGAGDVTVEKVKGSVEFEVGAGDITVNSEVQSLEGKLGYGKVNVKGLTGNADVRTGKGDISLSYATALKKAEVELRTGSGDTEVTFPAGTAVQTEFKSGWGKLSNELGDTPKGGVKLSVHSGNGNLTVKKAN